MKKSLFFAFLFSLINLSLFAQENTDSGLQSMMQKDFPCENVSNRCATLFVEYFQDGKIDLIPDLLDYWENKCGTTEAVQRAKTLYALDQNQYNDVVIKSNIIDLIFNYQNRESSIQTEKSVTNYQKDKTYFSYVPIGEVFDKYTLKLAAKNLNKYSKKSIEYAWCEFYSGSSDSIFYKIQKNKYSNSKLTYQYYEQVNGIKKMIDWNWAVSAGAWIPIGGISKLGVHPELGIIAGGRGGKFSLDFDVSIRFLNTSHYNAKWKDSTYNTNHFFGAYIGLDFGWDLYMDKKNSIALLGGIGWDGFEALTSEMLKQNEYVAASSYNFNFGVGFKRYISNSFYMGIQLKCNIVDYTLNDVVDYRGIPITFKIVFGSATNPMKRSFFEKLDYRGKY